MKPESAVEVQGNAVSRPTPPRGWRRLARLVLLFAVIYAVTTYLAVPQLWKRYARRHPAFEDAPKITHTGAGIPGDPLNVALVGTKAEVMRIMLAARWHPADGLTFRSCLEIAEATVLRRPYADAPVSNLYLFGRKQDLAFEQAVGNDPRKRHHVRFWLSPRPDSTGRPFWIGAATFDRSVGLSHTTGQITHHIGADIDTERDHVFATLKATGLLAEVYPIDDFHRQRSGKNGGGDPWHTDGRLFVGVIAEK